MIQSDGLWGHICNRFNCSDSSVEHLLQLMESISNISYGLRVVAACYTGAHLPLSFNIQSHYRFSISAFKAIIFSSFDVQSHHRFSVSAFRAIIASQFRRLKPSSLLSFGLQSHHRFLVLAFRAIIPSQFQYLEPSSLLSFSIQSRHHLFTIPGV